MQEIQLFGWEECHIRKQNALRNGPCLGKQLQWSRRCAPTTSSLHSHTVRVSVALPAYTRSHSHACMLKRPRAHAGVCLYLSYMCVRVCSGSYRLKHICICAHTHIWRPGEMRNARACRALCEWPGKKPIHYVHPDCSKKHWRIKM